jgi:hypothetical protein
MRRTLCLFALLVLGLSCQHAAVQARQAGALREMRDTLPERVARRSFDAYVRKDLDASFANYDTVFTHEYLGDPAGAKLIRRDDWLRQAKSNAVIPTLRFEIVRLDVFGAFVTVIWVSRTPDGKEIKHFDLFEVRHGKFVREIES